MVGVFTSGLTQQYIIGGSGARQLATLKRYLKQNNVSKATTHLGRVQGGWCNESVEVEVVVVVMVVVVVVVVLVLVLVLVAGGCGGCGVDVFVECKCTHVRL